MIIDGLRPSREDTTPMPIPALCPQELEESIRSNSLRASSRR
jgi:hypothetical protein